MALNLNDDGTPLTYRTAKSGPYSAHWQTAEDVEISRLLDSQTMHAKHHYDQPDDAEFMSIDIKDFYLNTALPRSEWMRIQVKFIFPAILAKYKLHQYIHNGAILFQVVKSLYGLPYTGKFSQDALIEHLAAHGYHQTITTTTCLFRHENNGIAFTLVVDDFGVKFKNKEAAQHLIDCLKLRYPITINWNATKYLGMTLRFDKVHRFVGLSIPGYIDKLLQRFPAPGRGANSPAIYTPPHYGSKIQEPTVDTS
jgi:hypothetical protein